MRPTDGEGRAVGDELQRTLVGREATASAAPATAAAATEHPFSVTHIRFPSAVDGNESFYLCFSIRAAVAFAPSIPSVAPSKFCWTRLLESPAKS
jgi:hypothetical protein